MGRKMKKQGIMLAVLLSVIYMQQPMFQQIVQAKFAVEKEEGGQPEGPKEPEEPNEPNEPDEPDEPEKPEEPMKMFSLKDSEPDGNHGYYITFPSVSITHNDSRGSTVYRFTNGDGEVTEKRLSGESKEGLVLPEMFRQGTNTLEAWMVDEEGKEAENRKILREYHIDTEKPSLSAWAPKGFDSWYQKEASVSASAQDGEKGSGILAITCYLESGQVGRYEEDSGVFLIDFASSGGRPVDIYIQAEDLAGNHAEIEKHVYIDNMPPKVWIEGLTDYMITSKPVNAVFKIQEDNALASHSVSVLWKDNKGKENRMPLSNDWEDTGAERVVSQTLEQDGIYNMEVCALDRSGFEARQKAQIIIDRNNPVISFTDEIDGAYLKEFCWKYPVAEIIKDFTTYTYEIKLDGRLYTLGERIIEEGAHYLRVQARDAAGNNAVSAARFVIDRTPPAIIFDEVEDGKIYEKEKAFKIRLSDSGDMFEEIKINGKSQKLNRSGKIYNYDMKQPGEYRVEVKAKDKAGNRRENSILFAVTEEKTILEKVLSPVKKSLGMEEEMLMAADGQKEGKEQKPYNKGALAVCIIALLAVSGAAAVKMLKK